MELHKSSDKFGPNPANGSVPEHSGTDSAALGAHASVLKVVIQSFEGETCDGLPNGEGRARLQGGHVFKGMFSLGLMHGLGVITWANGSKYEGTFVRNQIMGRGRYWWPDGSEYQGEVHNGVRHGRGTYRGPSMVYEGQWHQGKRHGKGMAHFEQDDWYKGDWVANMLEGYGARRYPTGHTYEGEWKHNLRHGEGTMRWLQPREQYEGSWRNGVQHGHGTYTWICERSDLSRFPRNDQYVGDFVNGQRHGHGTFHFANGEALEGEWRDDRRLGQDTFTCAGGRSVQGQFENDPELKGRNDQLIPALALNSSSMLPPDMTPDIDDLLRRFPERRREGERREVEIALRIHAPELRSIYTFYSRLGHVPAPDGVPNLALSRMQMWRLLKDCRVHHHDLTLRDIDRLTGDGLLQASPFSRMLFGELLTRLVIVAHHIYHNETSQFHLLASCFNKLMTNDVLPNAKHVQGCLFRSQDCTAVALRHCSRSWEVYKSTSREGEAMTCRDLTLLFQDLNLFGSHLTVAKFVEVMMRESASSSGGCPSLPMPFLDFFETLLGCAEVKGQLDYKVNQVTFNDQEKTTCSLTEESARADTSTSIERTADSLYATGPRDGALTKQKLPESPFNAWKESIDRFFDQIFFKAFEQHQKHLALKAVGAGARSTGPTLSS